MTDIITHIMNTVDKKCVKAECKRILKKCSFKSAKDLGNVAVLAVWLYVYGLYDEAIAVCDTIKDIPFTGNYTLWSNIDSVLCIKARILREQGQNGESETLIHIVNEHRHPELYLNLVEWFMNTLDKNIDSNLKDNSKAGAREWRIIKLNSAIRYREAGGFPVSDEKLESIIKDMVDILSLER